MGAHGRRDLGGRQERSGGRSHPRGRALRKDARPCARSWPPHPLRRCARWSRAHRARRQPAQRRGHGARRVEGARPLVVRRHESDRHLRGREDGPARGERRRRRLADALLPAKDRRLPGRQARRRGRQGPFAGRALGPRPQRQRSRLHTRSYGARRRREAADAGARPHLATPPFSTTGGACCSSRGRPERASRGPFTCRISPPESRRRSRAGYGLVGKAVSPDGKWIVGLGAGWKR